MKSTAKIRYEAYVKELAGLVGSRRQDQMRAYLEGLLLPGERKSIEPMAARIDPQNVRARHQAMHHFVANGDWDDAAFLKMARQKALSWVLYFGRLEAWIVDDTGFPKQGHHSVGVGHQ